MKIQLYFVLTSKILQVDLWGPGHLLAHLDRLNQQRTNLNRLIWRPFCCPDNVQPDNKHSTNKDSECEILKIQNYRAITAGTYLGYNCYRIWRDKHNQYWLRRWNSSAGCRASNLLDCCKCKFTAGRFWCWVEGKRIWWNKQPCWIYRYAAGLPGLGRQRLNSNGAVGWICLLWFAWFKSCDEHCADHWTVRMKFPEHELRKDSHPEDIYSEERNFLGL